VNVLKPKNTIQNKTKPRELKACLSFNCTATILIRNLYVFKFLALSSLILNYPRILREFHPLLSLRFLPPKMKKTKRNFRLGQENFETYSTQGTNHTLWCKRFYKVPRKKVRLKIPFSNSLIIHQV